MTYKTISIDVDRTIEGYDDKEYDDLIQVAYVGRQGSAALVEWYDEDDDGNRHAFRAIIPRSELGDSRYIERSTLESGIPYGEAWADHVNPHATSESIERALHDHNIWTAEDALARPKDAQAALLSAYGVDLADILTSARNIVKEDRNG